VFAISNAGHQRGTASALNLSVKVGHPECLTVFLSPEVEYSGYKISAVPALQWNK
jgi:hypothetical protein